MIVREHFYSTEQRVRLLSRVFDLSGTPPTTETLEAMRPAAWIAAVISFTGTAAAILALIGLALFIAFGPEALLCGAPDHCSAVRRGLIRAMGMFSALALVFSTPLIVIPPIRAVADRICPVEPCHLDPITNRAIVTPEIYSPKWMHQEVLAYARSHPEILRYLRAVAALGREPTLGEIRLIFDLKRLEDHALETQAGNSREREILGVDGASGSASAQSPTQLAAASPGKQGIAPRSAVGVIAIAAGLLSGVLASAAVGSLSGVVVAPAVGLWLWHVLSRRFVPDAQPVANAGLTGHKAEIVAEARRTLATLTAAAAAIECPEARSRLERVVASGAALIDQVSASAEGVRHASRTLAIFLAGLARISQSYAHLKPSEGEAALDAQFLAALDDVELQLEREHTRAHEVAMQDLDVQIAVLRQQLRYEAADPIPFSPQPKP